jgi:hypothetical protein
MLLLSDLRNIYAYNTNLFNTIITKIMYIKNKQIKIIIIIIFNISSKN